MATTSHVLSVSKQLERQLLGVNFGIFANVCSDLLTALGYENVQRAGRLRFKGKNREGGYDLEARISSPVGKRMVIVQLKQFEQERFVYQRYINEIIGAALRVGASEVVLITTGRLSNVLKESRTSLSRFLIPVRLIDGEELLHLLVEQGIGVKKEGALPIALDTAYFERLAFADSDFGQKESYRLPNLANQSTRLVIEIDLSALPKSSFTSPSKRRTLTP